MFASKKTFEGYLKNRSLLEILFSRNGIFAMLVSS